jgi:polyhydroxyalkanoate synthesis regulator protein
VPDGFVAPHYPRVVGSSFDCSEQFMAKPNGKVTIKKYANRRLYDTESSAYITLDRLAEMGLYGNSMQGVVPQYLESAMDAFKRNQKAITDAFVGNSIADLAKRNMEMFGGIGGGTKSTSAASEKELEELRAELAALQQKVDRLTK